MDGCVLRLHTRTHTLFLCQMESGNQPSFNPAPPSLSLAFYLFSLELFFVRPVSSFAPLFQLSEGLSVENWVCLRCRGRSGGSPPGPLIQKHETFFTITLFCVFDAEGEKSMRWDVAEEAEMAAEEQVDGTRDRRMRRWSEKGEANEDALVCGGEQTGVNEREKRGGELCPERSSSPDRRESVVNKILKTFIPHKSLGWRAGSRSAAGGRRGGAFNGCDACF